MATKIVTKNSSTASAVPTASDLVQGELAVNVADKRLFTEDNGGSIVELGTNPSTIDINAGTIDGTTVGASSASTGAFTTLTATGAFTSRGIDDNADATAITIDSSENVGIGTSSPSASLELNVPTGDGLLINSADVGTIKMTLANGSQKNWGFATTNLAAGDFGLYQSNSNGGDPITAGTAKLYINSSGNVGIGNTVASSMNAGANQLVVGSGSTGQGITLYSSSSETGSIHFADGTSGSEAYRGQLVYNHNGDYMAMLTAATERMRIDASGNVGIGTASPATKLDFGVTGNGTQVINLRKSANSVAGLGINAEYGVRIAGPSDATAPVSFGSIAVADGVTFTERMRIDSSGNVGIGTTNPVAQFAIGSAGRRIEIQGDAGTIRGFDRTATWAAIDFEAASYTFDIAGSEAMRIDSSGNVGIGTGSPNGNGILTLNTPTDNSPQIVFSENNTGKWLIGHRHDGDHFRFYDLANSVERMRIDSSGRVGIGCVPQSNLDIDVGIDTSLGLRSQTGVIVAQYTGAPAVGNRAQIGLGYGNTYTNVSIGAVRTSAAAYGTDDFIIATKSGTADAAPTERMRIDASGNLLVGSSSFSFVGSDDCVQISGTEGRINIENNTTSTTYVAAFYNTNGLVGRISTSGSSTSFNTTSDYRLKENVVAITGATERLKQLNPSRFNFIADADTTVDGFLAHEVADVVPEAIVGEKDAVDADGNPEYQGIDQSKLVPLLVATIQELEARITQLENN